MLVIARTKDVLLASLQRPIAEKENVYFIFLKNKMTTLQQEELKDIVHDFSILNDDTIVINLTENYHISKFTNASFEKKLRITATSRNKNTVPKIL